MTTSRGGRTPYVTTSALTIVSLRSPGTKASQGRVATGPSIRDTTICSRRTTIAEGKGDRGKRNSDHTTRAKDTAKVEWSTILQRRLVIDRARGSTGQMSRSERRSWIRRSKFLPTQLTDTTILKERQSTVRLPSISKAVIQTTPEVVGHRRRRLIYSQKNKMAGVTSLLRRPVAGESNASASEARGNWNRRPTIIPLITSRFFWNHRCPVCQMEGDRQVLEAETDPWTGIVFLTRQNSSLLSN